ncbi:unnamed protein product [Adineta ricciae]|uniref:Uncharacterized protein n=1 Tax=Adineta ricciae TaxID=249248 RepID=A0A813PH50_ADIRI|nr:unnamed protein product [Adineta ricciae]
MAETSLKNNVYAMIIALGTSGIFFLIGIALAGVLILSLIPLYVSDSSQQPYGDVYRISSLIIKAVYTNITVNFTGGNILSVAELSNICTQIFRAKNVDGFLSCVATNFSAYGPSNDTSALTALRRRRNVDDTSLYEIGDLLVLFSDTCSNRRALSKWYSRLIDGQNSSCVAQRATACRSFISSPNNITNSNQWLPFPVGYSQVIYTNDTSCAAVSVSKIYNIATTAYAGVYTRNNLTRPSGLLKGDCLYDSILPQTDLQNLISSPMNSPASKCTYTIG